MIRKYITTVIVALSLSAMYSCDTLDIENIKDYDAEKVWKDEKLINANMAHLYNQTFGNWAASADSASMQLSQMRMPLDKVTVTNDQANIWAYVNIRLINEAILYTDNDDLTDDFKKNIIAQAKFLRAFTYFKMLRNYGGVPYITKPQIKDQDDLYVKRNTSKECFELIVKDIDEAIVDLPEKISSSSSDYGKIDASFAKAFKAKVLLYKASPQFNPNNKWDNAYWQEAYEANKTAYEQLLSSGYKLTDDYSNIFLVERGPEAIFAVINKYPNRMADWDHGVRPGSESRGNAWACPSWEFVQEFPMKDGKLFNDPSGKYYKTDAQFLQGYWENRDPRFDKSVVWNGGIYEVSGKKGKRQYTSVGIAHEADDFGVNPNAGKNSTNLNSYSGFFIKKASNLALKQSEVQQYDIDYIVMRFAEVMLNYAETANETGHLDVAMGILKEIRQRAGIEEGTDGNYGIKATTREEMREAILAERNIELCFEGHRFWDLRRLRMLDRLDGKTKHGVEAIAINPDGSEMSMTEAKRKADNMELTEKDFKYIVLQVPFTGVKEMSVPESYYFFPIKKASIDRNSNLEQNKDWGGTFNPAFD